MSDRLSRTAKLAVGYARRIAASSGATEVGPDHLFLGVGELEDVTMERCLKASKVDLRQARVALFDRLEQGKGTDASRLVLSESASAAIEAADAEATALGDPLVEPPHLLLGLLADESGPVVGLVQAFLVDPSVAAAALRGLLEATRADADVDTDGDREKPQQAFPPQAEHQAAALLESLGRDLTQAAARGEFTPIVGRDKEIAELEKVFAARRRNNAVLIGEPGVGKTAIVEALAHRIAADKVPSLSGTRIRTLEVGSLVAGTTYRGDLEQRIKDLLALLEDQTDLILFIDEMHAMVGAGESSSASLDVANMLKPALSEGRLRVIGATTIDEYRRHLEPQRALMRRFQTVVVDQPSREDAVVMLAGLRPRYEEFYGVRVTDAAIEAAVDLSLRYLPERFLPDKALYLLDRTCVDVKLAAGYEGPPREVGADEVAESVSLLLEIPIARLTGDEKIRLRGMADALKRSVVGQDDIVDSVAQTVLSARLGMGHPGKPLAVFLLAGPSGVGKTKLAEALADFLGGEDQLVRLEMSLYTDANAVANLVGIPPGYAGWGEGGRLTNAVRAKPYSVVLFDEIEKAHPAVWNLLLPVLDEGRITDSLGRVIDFRNTVIILTSNVGSQRFSSGAPPGFAPPAQQKDDIERIREEVLEDVRATFPPEFENRFGQILIFRPIAREGLAQVIRRRIEEIAPVRLQLSDEALALLVEASYDPAMGARPVRRAIQKLVTNPLSVMLVHDELAEGDTVAVEAGGGALKFARTAGVSR